MLERILVFIGAGLAMFGLFALLNRAATKFGERKQREGSWEPDGPLHPTKPPLGSEYRRGQYIDAAVREYHKQRFAEDEGAVV